jgi:hypothetical protein
MRPLFVVLSASALVLAGSVFADRALAKGESIGAFTPAHDADLLDQPTGKQKVGHLSAHQSYPLIKTGGPGGVWCKVDAGNNAVGWILCSEGEHADARPNVPPSAPGTTPTTPRAPQPGEQLPSGADATGPAPSASEGHATGCSKTCSHAPLFDKPISLTDLDKEILAVCPANPEASVSEGDVRRFMAKHYDDKRIQQALSMAGRSGNKESNLDWLTGLWVGQGPRNAFTHVFCGDDWSKGKLGGLHFLPRYAQLESEHKICYSGPVKGNAVQGDQYLIRYNGVAPWSCGEKAVGGFPVEHDAVAVVATATRAFVRCCDRSGGKQQSGVYKANDLGGPAWQIWCGTRNGSYGIASIYPTDEAPTCGQ